MACDRPGICVKPVFYGGLAGFQCRDGKTCIDDPGTTVTRWTEGMAVAVSVSRLGTWVDMERSWVILSRPGLISSRPRPQQCSFSKACSIFHQASVEFAEAFKIHRNPDRKIFHGLDCMARHLCCRVHIL